MVVESLRGRQRMAFSARLGRHRDRTPVQGMAGVSSSPGANSARKFARRVPVVMHGVVRFASWHGLAVAMVLVLAGCNSDWMAARDRNEVAFTTAPTNHRTEIIAMMRSYLNDPTNVRDAYISEPGLRTLDGVSRTTVACATTRARATVNTPAARKPLCCSVTVARIRSSTTLAGSARTRPIRPNFPESSRPCRGDCQLNKARQPAASATTGRCSIAQNRSIQLGPGRLSGIAAPVGSDARAGDARSSPRRSATV